MSVLVLVVLLTFWPALTAAFDVNSYDFGVGKAFEKLCHGKEKKHLVCSWDLEDFKPARIGNLLSGWNLLRRGEFMLPLLEEMAQDLLHLQKSKLKPLERQLGSSLASIVEDLFALLFQGRSYQLAFDLLGEFHESQNINLLKIFSPNNDYTFYVGKYRPDLILHIIDQHDFSCYGAPFNDPSGRILEAAIGTAARKNQSLVGRLSTYLCQGIVGERSPEHLKRLNEILKQFASTVEYEPARKHLIAGADICYGSDVQLALDLIKQSGSFYGRGRAFFGVHSNNFAISLAATKEQIMDEQLSAFIRKVEKQVPDLEALWPYFQHAGRRFSDNGGFKNGIKLILAWIELVLNSGRAGEFKVFLRLALNEVYERSSFNGPFPYYYRVKVTSLEGFRALFYQIWPDYSYIVFELEADAFAGLIAEDPALFKTSLVKNFGMLSNFFEKIFVLKNEQNLFISSGSKDDFVGVLDVLLLRNDLLDVKAFTLEQAKRLFREFMRRGRSDAVRSFILAVRPLIAFIRYWWGSEAIAQLPSQVTEILSEYKI